MMCRHMLRLQPLKHFLDGEQVWPLFMRHSFPQLISLTALQSCIRCRPKRGAWHLECCQVLMALYKVGNAASSSSTLAFCRRLVEGECNNVLKEILDVNKDQLIGLFWITFKPGPIDNFQKSLVPSE